MCFSFNSPHLCVGLGELKAPKQSKYVRILCILLFPRGKDRWQFGLRLQNTELKIWSIKTLTWIEKSEGTRLSAVKAFSRSFRSYYRGRGCHRSTRSPRNAKRSLSSCCWFKTRFSRVLRHVSDRSLAKTNYIGQHSENARWSTRHQCNSDWQVDRKWNLKFTLFFTCIQLRPYTMSAPQALKKVVINGNRFYQSANDPTKLYPSVTTILSSALPKPGLSAWQRRFSVDSFKRKILSSASTYHTPGTKANNVNFCIPFQNWLF